MQTDWARLALRFAELLENVMGFTQALRDLRMDTRDLHQELDAVGGRCLELERQAEEALLQREEAKETA